jgi:ankyrin repeat protein
MEAASIRSEDLVYLLLRNGADMTILDSAGRDALAIAKKRRNKRVVSLLEEASDR